MKVVTPLQLFPSWLIFFASYLMSLKKRKNPDIYSTFNVSSFSVVQLIIIYFSISVPLWPITTMIVDEVAVATARILCSSSIKEHLIPIFSFTEVTLQCPLRKNRVAQPVDDSGMETFPQGERLARNLCFPSSTPLPAILDSNGGGKKGLKVEQSCSWAAPHLQQRLCVAWPVCTRPTQNLG